MSAFIVHCENRPGELARISEAVAERGINITSFGSVAWGDTGAVGLLTSDESGTREALDKAGLTYREVEVVEFSVADRPGTLAEASRTLAKAGVNIEFLVPTGMRGGEYTVAAAVDNLPAARQALGSRVTARA